MAARKNSRQKQRTNKSKIKKKSKKEEDDEEGEGGDLAAWEVEFYNSFILETAQG